ncbi:MULTISPECIES: electron transfer flavoprotein subunit alpha/FixB family protein [Sellimonas]|uniref:Electron transfer flavoprotein subunit alpha/FixB family protein n=2 Tax=Sellimonas TaxID=1769710 RepID=A0ABS7L9A3_9FIRM|nr:electron transfer flavoprotein subunit alpha/FixB family protein [Sellimonas caecigallum]MBY0759661.1 electron transfer flavoprotein subunit alpha/FixB family protein [Sellimonas caecigallum]OUP64612.1 electron transfer flavoprotein subunit alpha [Drancourtella sp. An177]
MANGICIFAENYNGKLEPASAELVSAARLIQETTKEEISAIVAAKDCDTVVEELKGLGVEKIYVVKTSRDILLQDDAASEVIAEMLRKIDPSSVLIPATPTGRSIFSRVAMKLNCGLTADCTELLVGTREDGSYYIKQNKPSFGENVFVTIITREGYYPQMMTVRPGVYTAPEASSENSAEVVYMDDIAVPDSQIEVVEVLPTEDTTDSILSSEIVVVGGRGVLEDDNFALVKEFADKIGAAIGGTRPMVDTETIPFEHQIGQTGCTIRPKICISLGVSGAIQHTEGIKDTKLFVAVNTDPNAAIFKVADYGMTADLRAVLENYLKL